MIHSDTCKSKDSISFALTLNGADFPPLLPPIHAHKCKHSTYSIICNQDLRETHGSNYASSTSKLFSTKTVCKPARIVGCNKLVIFSPVYKSRHSGHICISKAIRCSVSCKREKLFVLVMLVWLKNLTLSITL